MQRVEKTLVAENKIFGNWVRGFTSSSITVKPESDATKFLLMIAVNGWPLLLDS